MKSDKFLKPLEMLDEGVKEGVFPGAAACIGDKDGILAEKCAGCKQLYPVPENMETDTLFDLASLTKVVATTPLLMLMLQIGKISLYDFVGDYLDPFKNDNVRIIHLLTHTSGFEPFSALYQKCRDFDDAIVYISKTKRIFPLNQSVLYSDYNFIVLKAVIEKILGEPLDVSCEKYVFEPLDMHDTSFNPTNRQRAAATEYDKITDTYLKGIVHDENARFFGGVSGHAGLFSTLHDLSLYCRMYLNEGRTLIGDVFFAKSTIDCIAHNYTKGMEEGRGLGFCVKDYENSSAGELMSEGSIGHTGVTGTSLWIDRKLGLFFILLTNRVHPSSSNNKIIRFRSLFHNAAVSAAML